jgi:hypothetical protein
MVTMGRPKTELTLSDEERQELRAMLRRQSPATTTNLGRTCGQERRPDSRPARALL